MADGVELNAGSGGAIAATDDCGAAGHTQIVKLAISTDGSATAIPADAANGLDVDITRMSALVAGSALIGKVSIDQATANANEVVVKSGTVTAVTSITNAVAVTNAGLTTLASAVSGTEMQVDVVGALPAGTALLGKVGIDQATANANEVVIKSGTVTAVTSITNAVAVTNAGITTIAGAVSGSEMQVDVVAALPAGTNTIGGTIAQASSSIVYDGTTACTVKRVSVANPADGATLIAGVADKKFRVLAFAIFTESATVTNFWLEDADGADVFGDSTGIPLITTGATGASGLVLQWNPGGWFQTATANKNLVIQLTSAQPVVVCITYIEVA